MKNKLMVALAIALTVTMANPALVYAGNEWSYTVEKGDTLWGIAKKYLGKGILFKEIFERNSDVISVPNLIYPGTEIIIPKDAEEQMESNNEAQVDTYKVSGDDYQQPYVYLGTSYNIEKIDSVADYIITANPDVAIIDENGMLVPKGIGAGCLWILDENGEIVTNFGIIVVEEEAHAVWEGDEAWDAWIFTPSGKTIKDVQSSDETVAKAFIKDNKVYASGKGVGKCTFTVNYGHGIHDEILVCCIGPWEQTYEENFAEVERILQERKNKGVR